MKGRAAFKSRAARLDKAAGEADILVSVFDALDTEIAVGNTERQVVDRGAFRNWIEASDLDAGPTPMFVDHGEAPIFGAHLVQFKVGKVTSAQETDEGLQVRASYNLEKQIARDAFSDLQHDPAGAQFSFAWDLETEVLKERDGTTHAIELWPYEFSQVAFGAQRLARLVVARAAEVSSGRWSKDSVRAALSDEGFRNAAFEVLYDDKQLAETVQEIVEEALAPDVIAEWYRSVLADL